MVCNDHIDLKMLRRYIDDCENQHRDTCEVDQANLNQFPLPLLLVDTYQCCLVTVHEPVRFFALSYVWGQVNAFLTSSANLAALSIPGALSQRSNMIPRTIFQAISLTKALGEQYLWVDALCIVQDSIEMASQLDAMATLFSCAALTIVAADGLNANAGFRGLKDISAPRFVDQRLILLTRDRALLQPHRDHIWTDDKLQPWSTRAWTFQEAICSRRLLYFAHDTVRWVCRGCRRSEESMSSDCLKDYAFSNSNQLMVTSPSFSSSDLPDMTELVALINGYNTRNSTYPQDAFNAFAGVMNTLSRKFSGGFIGGLPVMFFDICLLWRPLHRTNPPTARFAPIDTSIFPSWSWLAYQTEISMPLSWMRQEDPSGPTPAMVKGHKPFYTINILYGYDRNVRSPIPNDWLLYADRNTKDNVPTDWKTQRVPHVFDARRYEQSYTYKQHDDVEFWFPVIVSEDTCSPKHNATLDSARHARFLFFTTTYGYFQLGCSQRTATQILTSHGTNAGTLYAHDQAGLSSSSQHSDIMLVAILGNVIPKEDFEIWQDISPEKGGIRVQARQQRYDTGASRGAVVYHVLWVQEINGVYYRKGTGVVDRAVWERCATRTLDVVLA